MRRFTWTLLLGLAVLLVVPTGCAATPESWAEGTTHGPWNVVFTGYGEVTGTEETVTLNPTSAGHEKATHGALVVRRDEVRDVRFKIAVTTERQNRRNTPPNPWEVGWVLWHYTDPDHFYAVALKPNGWELSKQDPAYPGKQRFLASGVEPAFPVGEEHEVEVTQVANTITVAADGRMLTRFVDDERPYLRGPIGVYTEDARVTFGGLEIHNQPTDGQ